MHLLQRIRTTIFKINKPSTFFFFGGGDILRVSKHTVFDSLRSQTHLLSSVYFAKLRNKKTINIISKKETPLMSRTVMLLYFSSKKHAFGLRRWRMDCFFGTRQIVAVVSFLLSTVLLSNSSRGRLFISDEYPQSIF